MMNFIHPIKELDIDSLYAITAALETLINYSAEHSLALEELEETYSQTYYELILREHNYQNPFKN